MPSSLQSFEDVRNIYVLLTQNFTVLHAQYVKNKKKVWCIDGNSFGGDVVLNTLNKAYRDDDNILD